MSGDERLDADEPPRELREAVEQFNRGEYFECHETLEQLWAHEVGPIRSFHQGIIQIATGLYHLRRGNPRGTRFCLDGGLERLRPAPPFLQNVDVTRLVDDAQRLRGLVDQEFEAAQAAALPRIHWVRDPVPTATE